MNTQPPSDFPPPSTQGPARIDSPPEVGIPRWVKIAAAITGILVVISVCRLPKALSASIANERGERYRAVGNIKAAAIQFDLVVAAFPNSIEAILNAAEADIGLNRNPEAAALLVRLEGRTLDEDETSKADNIAAVLNQRWEALKKQQGHKP